MSERPTPRHTLNDIFPLDEQGEAIQASLDRTPGWLLVGRRTSPDTDIGAQLSSFYSTQNPDADPAHQWDIPTPD